MCLSKKGQGDGGVYFSLKGPSSYGYGATEVHPEYGDYETRLITDCYGKERLQEFYGKDSLSLVLICVVEEGLISQAPGGRDNALVIFCSIVFVSILHLSKLIYVCFHLFLNTDGIKGSFRNSINTKKKRWLLLPSI